MPAFRTLAILLIGAALAAPAALAQEFPARPIRLIVPFPPGGATDTVARAMAQPMGEALRQPIVVDNRPGANAIVGMEACARAAADGYTYCITNNDSITFNPVLYARLPYDPAKDLIPIAKAAEIEQIIVAAAGFAPRTLAEAIQASRTKPATFSTFGNGSMGHLYLEWFNGHTGAKFTHVPYRGAGPALEAVIKGEVDLSLFAVGAARQHIAAGRLKGLAVIADRRSTHLPDVPALTELNRDFVVSAWLGIFAPRGVPDAIVRRMSQEINKVLADPAVQAKWRADHALIAAPNSPAEFASFVEADAKVAAAQIRAAKITLD
ncbi:MAG: tripartite tricarboxylate transporter substrate-binding protein [Tagaea sp.]|nr:tripartite tricarboxylate transporter substrate-binding protein [Tagaea sp.]